MNEKEINPAEEKSVPAKKPYKKAKVFIWACLPVLLLAFALGSFCFHVDLVMLTGIIWLAMLGAIAFVFAIILLANFLKSLWRLKWPVILSVLIIAVVPLAVFFVENGKVFNIEAILNPILDSVLSLLK